MKIDKREQILDATEKILTTTTNNDLSINMIAKEMGIAKGGIYYYFNSKEDILYAVIERAFKTAILQSNISQTDNCDILSQLKSLFGCLITKTFVNNKNNILYSIAINENALFQKYIQIIAIKEITPLLENLISKGEQMNKLNLDTSAHDVAEMIVAVLSFFLTSSIFDSSEYNNKLKLFGKVIETCLGIERGSLNFLAEQLPSSSSNK